MPVQDETKCCVVQPVSKVAHLVESQVTKHQAQLRNIKCAINFLRILSCHLEAHAELFALYCTIQHIVRFCPVSYLYKEQLVCFFLILDRKTITAGH